MLAAEEDDDFELDLTAEAPLTTDSLQQFLNEAGRYPLLTAAEEVELAKRIERGDLRRQGADDHLEPAAGRLDRPPVPDAGHHARRPDPGGRDRADPRDGEVRLAQGLQVLDLRDLVDPPGGAARRRQQGAHDPHPGPRRRARAEGRADRARAAPRSWAAADATRRSPSARSCRSSRCARCARPPARSLRPTPRSAPTATRASASCSPPAARRPRTRSTSTIRGDAVRRAVAKLPDRQRDVISLRFGLVGDGPELARADRQAARHHARARPPDRGRRPPPARRGRVDRRRRLESVPRQDRTPRARAGSAGALDASRRR